MIESEIDQKITNLKNSVHRNSLEIHRLQDETVKLLHQIRDLEKERDNASGMIIRLIDADRPAAASHQGARF